jgi:hypothetical protein
MQQLCSFLYGSSMNALMKTYNIGSNVTYEIKEDALKYLRDCV